MKPNHSLIFRPVKESDSTDLNRLVRAVFTEFKLDLSGAFDSNTTYYDFHASYNTKGSLYLVLECDNRIIGGIGVMPLPDILHACEIKHFYISAEHRGTGYGRQLFHKMWDAIQSMGYRSCYLESSSKFTRALKFYESNGFDYLKRPYKSGHEHICGVQMLKHIV